MVRVVLGCVDRAFAGAVRVRAATSSELRLSEIVEGEKVFSEIDRDVASVGALILGSAFADPVQMAQRIQALDKDLSIVIVSPADRFRALRQELQFAPFLGPQVRCMVAEKIAAPEKLVSEAAEMTRQRRAFRATARSVSVSADTINPWHRQSVEYLDHLLDHAPIGVVLLDRHMAMVALNRESQALLEVAQEDAVGEKFISCFEQEESGRLDQFLQRTAATMGPKTPEVFRRLQADATHRYFDVVASTLAQHEGSAWLMVMMGDCTDRVRSEEQRKRLMNELDHRVKNSLATVLSLARRTSQVSKDTEQFMQAFEGRVLAMARVHETLAAGHWRQMGLNESVALVLQTQVASDHRNVHIGGDHIFLEARVAQPICMALHELMTNALKYGSMSVSEGGLDVHWELLSDRTLVIDWHETGGPATSEPAHSGFGGALIRGLVEHELSGQLSLDFKPQGLECRIQIPLSEPKGRAISVSGDR
jgi:PAS domain S-box-containing protein